MDALPVILDALVERETLLVFLLYLQFIYYLCCIETSVNKYVTEDWRNPRSADRELAKEFTNEESI